VAPILFHAHSRRMKHTCKFVLTLWLACSTLFAQENAGAPLHNALLKEQRGQFDAAIDLLKPVTDSNQLSSVELGRAYTMLGFAYHQRGKFTDAQAAFERSLRIFEHDPEHASDYATALNDYGELFGDAGQFDNAAAMWQKALHLRQQMGEHSAAMRTLTNLSELAEAQHQTHEAREYVKKASAEMKAASDLTNDDRMRFLEAQGWLALAEGHASGAVHAFQRALDLCVQTRGEKHWLTGWEHMLRGKAYAQSGNTKNAIADMGQGLAILDHALGNQNLKYFAAETAYSQVLDQAGLHAQAAQLRTAVQQTGKEFNGNQCVGCTIDMAGLR
jgi:Tfp pilus assembly protein PilF